MNGTENENTSDSKSSAIEEMFENENETVKCEKEIKCTEWNDSLFAYIFIE